MQLSIIAESTQIIPYSVTVQSIIFKYDRKQVFSLLTFEICTVPVKIPEVNITRWEKFGNTLKYRDHKDANKRQNISKYV